MGHLGRLPGPQVVRAMAWRPWPPKGISWADLGTPVQPWGIHPGGLVTWWRTRVGRRREPWVPGLSRSHSEGGWVVASVLPVCFHKTRPLDKPSCAHSMVPGPAGSAASGNLVETPITGSAGDPRLSRVTICLHTHTLPGRTHKTGWHRLHTTVTRVQSACQSRL